MATSDKRPSREWPEGPFAAGEDKLAKEHSWAWRYRMYWRLPSDTEPFTPWEADQVRQALLVLLKRHGHDDGELTAGLWSSIRGLAHMAVWQCEMERFGTDPKVPDDFRGKYYVRNRHRELYKELAGKMPKKDLDRFLRQLRNREPSYETATAIRFLADVSALLRPHTGRHLGVSVSKARATAGELTGPGLAVATAVLAPFMMNVSAKRIRAMLREARKLLNNKYN